MRTQVDVSPWTDGVRTLRTEQKAKTAISMRQYPESKPSRISSSSLNTSRRLHVYPIKVVVYHRAYWFTPWGISSWGMLPT